MAEKTILCTRKNNRKKHLNVTVLFSQFFKKQMYCRAIRELRRATEGAVASGELFRNPDSKNCKLFTCET